MINILAAIAADPNVDPSFRAAMRPVGFGEYDNYVVQNRLGQITTVVFARSESEALRVAYAPEGYTARVQDYRSRAELDAGRRARENFGAAE